MTKMPFLAILMLVALIAGGQTPSSSPKITDLFSPDEIKKSGLSKLNADEIAALNAAIFRAMVRINTASDLTSSATTARSENKGLDFYDSQGRAVAYVDEDEELTIYLWEGKPVAYLDENNVYGFNGNHLGWLRGNAIDDHHGHVVAALAEVFSGSVRSAPAKGFKQFLPFKAFKAFIPFEPFLSSNWSDTPAKVFFLSGSR